MSASSLPDLSDLTELLLVKKTQIKKKKRKRMSKCNSHLSPTLLTSSQIVGANSQNFNSFLMESRTGCVEKFI